VSCHEGFFPGHPPLVVLAFALRISHGNSVNRATPRPCVATNTPSFSLRWSAWLSSSPLVIGCCWGRSLPTSLSQRYSCSFS